MKKFVLGIALLVCGVLGFVIWPISCAVGNSGSSVVFGYMHGSEILVQCVFGLMALVGLVLAICEIRTEK